MAIDALLVDDSGTTRAMLAKMLRLAELPIHEIHQAADGAEALEFLRDHPVELVISDLNMPNMTGLELIDQLARDGLLDYIAVIVLSTEGSQERIEHLRSEGIRAYLRKPCTPEEVKRTVCGVMGWDDEA